MHRRLLRLLLLVCVLSCSATFPTLAAAQRAVPNGFVGVNLDGPMYPQTSSGIDLSSQFNVMEAAGVETIRVVFDWSYSQPVAHWAQVPSWSRSLFVDEHGVPTRYDQLDEIVALAAVHGITVLPTVMYAPGWDSAPHTNADFARPARVGPYAAYVSDLVKRYGPNGAFWNEGYTPREPIREWQIWNEPNIPTFWPTQPFQKTYAALLKGSRSAVRKADPGAKIVLAGIPNYSWKALARLYSVKGSRNDFDIVAVHPYTAKPSGVITILQKIRRVMKRNGDAHKPLIADEISWTSAQGKTSHNVGLDIATTERGQANRIAKLLPMLAKDRASLRLLGFYYYTWAGAEQPGGLTFAYAGLLKYVQGVLAEKPAFNAFVKAALAMEDCRRKGTLATTCADPG